MLLPQGKFENFLAAKTDARLAILRGLFDVSLYRRLATKFKEEAVATERLVRQEREICAGRLKAEGFESTEALADPRRLEVSWVCSQVLWCVGQDRCGLSHAR